ncbi:hypothetical protein ACFWAF_02860 [Streptomyces microflavus]|uniref:hypothetical protein n=1 Tax=Streptomyces microflavus TaxID=1919 RepID=UPI003651358C
MPDTTPTPADRPADLLRAAAERARETGDPLHAAVADLLTHQADTLNVGRINGTSLVICEPCCETMPCQHIRPALAVARQLLGTTPCGCPHPADEHSVYGCAEDCACEWMPPRAPAVPPAPADRAAVFREAADAIDAETRRLIADGVLEHDKLRPCRDASAQLRALADDAAAGVQPPTSEAEAGGCWCGHPEERHFTSQAMTLPNGCHDCQGWNGAHAYGQDLPWAAAPAAPEEPTR